jgi:signal transduction histidine kinase
VSVLALEHFRTYFEELPGYVSVQDRSLRIIACNRRFSEDFPDPLGGFCYQVYKRLSEPCPSCPVAETFRDGRPRRSEQVIVGSGGEDVRILATTAPIRDDNGDVVAVMEVSTDVTEIKRLQERCRTLFSEAPCYISVQDRSLRILEANRRFRDDFGDPNEGHCYEVYKHRKEPCLVCPVAITFEDGKTHSSEEVVTARDGRHINVLCYTAPLRDAKGEITSVMEMSTNITELRQLQSQLASLGLVVGSISHDIKGLLNGLGGGVYLMETGFKKDDIGRIRTGWDMIRRNVDRIKSVVMNVLYYAKDREMQPEPVDPSALIADVAGVLEDRARQLRVELVSQTEAAPGCLNADPRALHSLLVNLVENALDACRMDRRKPDHRVALSARTDGDVVCFEVADNGIGMDRETRERAFSPFYSSKGTEGTGLGLFIAHKIATSHGGSIAIESEQDMGTRFTVRIPYRKPLAGDEHLVREPRQ